eukprot:2902531-Rhodomonas_salina.1
MIDFGILSLETTNLGGHSSLHVATPYDGTIYDRSIWDHTPQPSYDGNEVDKWSAKEWHAWADKYDDIPSCGSGNHESELPPQLQPSIQQLAATWNPHFIEPEASLTKDSPVQQRAGPGHLVLCCHALLLAAIEKCVTNGQTDFKRAALENAKAVSPVGKELIALHLFPQPAGPKPE